MRKRVVILGAGISGIGAALLAKKMDLDVFVSDNAKIDKKQREILFNNLYIMYSLLLKVGW